MKKSINVLATAVSAVLVSAASLSVAMGGCGGSTSNPGGGGGGGAKDATTDSEQGSGTGTGGSLVCSAQDDIIEIVFSPMYSAVVPGSSAHTFQVPAIVAGVSPSAVMWKASSNDVTLQGDPSTGGVLITMNPEGVAAGSTTTQVTIYAFAGGSCGQATLNITTTTNGAWDAGAARYNDGVPIPTGMDQGMVFNPPDGGLRIACANCHTPQAATADGGTPRGLGSINDVAHTPEQTGGFSDQQLLDIVQNGTVPGWSPDGSAPAADAGYFDPTIVDYRVWNRFHRWNLTSAETTGIVTYLRALTPESQGGTANFGGFGGGHPPPDGGYHFPDGGFPHHFHDGGPMGPGMGTGTGAENGDAAAAGH